MPNKTWFPSSKEGGGAKGLAKKYGIKLADIEPHRSDLKVTIEDVKRAKDLKDRGMLGSSKASTSSTPRAAEVQAGLDALRSSIAKKAATVPLAQPLIPGLEEPPQQLPSVKKVVRLTLTIEPKILDSSDEKLILNNSNLNLLKRWWERHLPGVKYNVDMENEVIWVVKGPGNKYLLKVQVDLTNAVRGNLINQDEVDIAIEGIKDLDDDGNYPVWILNGNILTIEKIKRDSPERDDLEDSGAVQGLVTGQIVGRQIDILQKFGSRRGSFKFGSRRRSFKFGG
tara:strand:- start:1060 stop:1908 length:849 start_codon:yes stop_codon:yes gene_type:complete